MLRTMHAWVLKPTGMIFVLLFGELHTGPAMADGCLAPSFGAARTFGAGRVPVSMAVADFNGDGKPDLAVANQGDYDFGSDTYINRGISVLLSNGDGTFQTARRTAAASGPLSISIAAGDFNADGKPDLAVAVQALLTTAIGHVSVLLGKGDGSFQSAVNYPVGYTPYSVTVGDFNEDDKPDLAVANQGSYDPGSGSIINSSVSVLMGKGDGAFQNAVNLGQGPAANFVTVGDFNGDGKDDLAGVEYGSFDFGSNISVVSVRLGNGDGSFQTAVYYAAGTLPSSIAVGDFNRDGKSDLAVANTGAYDQSSGVFIDSGVSVLLGIGDGAFQTAVPYGKGTAVNSITVGDFNGDGKADLAVGNTGHLNESKTFFINSGVSALLGDGDGAFQTAVNYAAGLNPTSVAAADFNGDGKPDLAVGNFESANVSVRLNTCISDIALTIVLSGTNVTVSWLFPSTGFVLESTPSLGPPNWQLAVEEPTTNDARLEISAPLNLPQRFLRLRKP